MKFNQIKSEPTVSTGSMADIAFLLLIFFLVATTLQRDRGLMLQLPPDVPPTEALVNARNLFKIRINSANQFLVEEEVVQDLSGISEEIQRFVLNPNNDSRYAESPQKAIVSIKAQRGTKYSAFIETLDHVKEAYYQMYGNRLALTSAEFRKLDLDDPIQSQMYAKARMDLPMNISIAETDKAN